MAEFALGLTKAAVEGTLIRVKSAIEEEARLKVRVQNDLIFITGEFQMMQSFLKVANKERAKNEVVRTWVRQVRDLAFDVEDCVELVIHLDATKWWSWMWRRVCQSCIPMIPPLPLDVAVSEIQHLKVRVMDVSERNTRYNLLSNSDDSMLAVTTPYTGTSSPTFRILNEVWEEAGKHHDTRDLKELITCEGSDLQVVSLWQEKGPTSADHLPGVSHFITEAYNDPEICKTFDIRFWVKLPRTFNPEDLPKTLLSHLCATSSHLQANHRGIGTTEDHLSKTMVKNLEQDIKAMLKEKRYLVILEDVSSLVEWDTIGKLLPDSKNGSRMIVSTQNLRTARVCIGGPYQVSHLTRFSDGHSVCAFSNKDTLCRSDIGEINWQIRRRGVISVLLRCNTSDMDSNGEDRDISEPCVGQLYEAIRDKHEQYNFVVFEEHSWVDVPYPFNVHVFAVRLFLNFQSGEFCANEIVEVGKKGDKGVIDRCRRYLREADCLVVINGLRSTKDWDTIKSTFLSGRPTTPTNNGKGSSIIVVTREANVAKYCVDQQHNREFSIRDVETDQVLGRYMKDRRSQFELGAIDKEISFLENRIGVISVWGPSDHGRCAQYGPSYVVRSMYDKALFYRSSYFASHSCSLVDVHDGPIDWTDFCWRLIMDFRSGGVQDREAAAVNLMRGYEPFETCSVFLHSRSCLIVVDGLRSWEDWNELRMLTEFTAYNTCIIVITDDENLAMHCVHDKRNREQERKRKRRDKRERVLHVGSDCRRPAPMSKEQNEQLVGRTEEMLHLGTPGVISLWGFAGVGKSAIARHTYRDHLLQNKGSGTQKSSWVEVPHPFHLEEFSQRLLLGFHSEDINAKETAAVGIMEGALDAIQACGWFLRQDNCLVVIDGLRSTHDWDLIKATFLSGPTYQSKSCIIVITTEARVATYCASDDKRRVHNIKGLDARDALDLFRQIAWNGKHLSAEEKSFSELAIAKCGGLPKVIVAIGHYTASKIAKIGQGWEETTLTTISRDMHDDFMSKLETHSIFHGLRGMFSWMNSYFDECSDSLKPCIFYLSVFPANHKSIRPRRLLRRWIAEGYSRDTCAGSTSEENGEKLFSELVDSSIIQLRPGVNKNNVGNVLCQVNGFFHEYIISRPMEENLVFALEGRCSTNSQRAGAGQHLTIRSNWDRDEIVFKSMDLSRLRSLTVFGEFRSFFISKGINMRLLRVLDLEDTTSGLTDAILERIGTLLPRLKFLSLRGCKDVTMLPDSLGSLRQLQTLDIRYTRIATLPCAIIKLVKLQYIRAGTSRPVVQGTEGNGASTSLPAAAVVEEGDTNQEVATPPPQASDGASTSQPLLAGAEGDDTPTHQQGADGDRTLTTWSNRARGFVAHSWLSKKLGGRRSDNGGGVNVPVSGIRKLTALHTLGVVNVSSGAGGKAILEELKKLTQLRKLGVSGIGRENWKEFCSVVSGHRYLESLSVRLDDEQHEEQRGGGLTFSLDDIPQPPETLKSLKLHGRNTHVRVSSIKKLGNLRKARLDQLTLYQRENLHGLFGTSRGVDLVVPVLKMVCTNNWEVDFSDSTPQCIKVLMVYCPHGDTMLRLYGLVHIPDLKEVWLKGSYNDEMIQILQDVVAEHPNKPVFKLEPRSSLTH